MHPLILGIGILTTLAGIAIKPKQKLVEKDSPKVLTDDDESTIKDSEAKIMPTTETGIENELDETDSDSGSGRPDNDDDLSTT